MGAGWGVGIVGCKGGSVGKASKLLYVLVTDPTMLEWPEIKKLEAQGHTVTSMGTAWYDIVLGPTAWMMTEELRKYLPLAVRAAREKKYGGKEVKADVLQDQVEKQEGGDTGGGVVEGAVGDSAGGDREVSG